MAEHDWGRLFVAGQLADGPCIWCGLAKNEVVATECPKHPRTASRSRPVSIVDDFVGNRLDEIRKNEGRGAGGATIAKWGDKVILTDAAPSIVVTWPELFDGPIPAVLQHD